MPVLTSSEIAQMRADLTATQLAMTATIQRFTATGTDAHGQATGTWANLATGVACWWWESTEDEVIGPQKSAVVTAEWLVFPANQDVRSDDRVTLITGVDAAAVNTVTVNIRETRKRLLDVVCRVEEVVVG